MKNTKKQWVIFLVGAIVLLIMWYGAFRYYDNTFSHPGRTFMRSLPQLSGIDTSRQVCFELGKEWEGASTIDCFIPDDFDKHTEGFENTELFKEVMKSARVLNVQPLADEKKSAFLQFYDTIQPVSNKNAYLSIKKEITERIQSRKATKSDYEKNIYFLALEGQYDKAQQERNKYCARFKIDCKKETISYTLQGKVLSGSGTPISGVTIRVAGDTASVKTDIQGNYVLIFSTFPQTKVRVEAYKPGFSNAFYPIDILSPVTQQSGYKDFTLETPVQFAIIDTVHHTITGENTRIDGKNFIIKTKWSQYSIPFNALVHRDGSSFRGTTNAYFFEFNKQSHNEDLLRNDIFDTVVGYAGNLMKTFGMPYVLFVTDDGETIHVLKSHPIPLANKLQEMEALRTNADKIYSSVTDNDMQFLIQKSKELWGYPINREFLIQNNMLRFPLWWVFDQRKGIWVNHPMRVISEDGTIETTFYTISEIQK